MSVKLFGARDGQRKDLPGVWVAVHDDGMIRSGLTNSYESLAGESGEYDSESGVQVFGANDVKNVIGQLYDTSDDQQVRSIDKMVRSIVRACKNEGVQL